MKRTALVIILAIFLTATVCFAQTATQTAKPAGAQANAPAQSQPAQTAPAGQSPASGQAPATQPPAGKRPPQAKTQAEMTDFNAVLEKGKVSAKDGAQAADEFAVKYPDSELKWLLYQQTMLRAQAGNDEETMVDMGRKAIQGNPDDSLSLAMVAMVLAERTRESDLDKAEKTAEALKDANHSLESVGALQINAQATPEQVEGVRNQIRAIAYGALGTVDFNDKNDAKAVDNLRKATTMPGVPADPLTSLRLALALDHLQKYADALQVANGALQAAQEPTLKQTIQQEQTRLVKLTSGTGSAPTAAASAPPAAGATAPKPAQPPASTATQPKPPP